MGGHGEETAAGPGLGQCIVSAAEGLLNGLLLTDTNGRPFELIPQSQGAGIARIGVPDQKFELMMVLPVRGFGQTVLYADNAGRLYTPSAVEGRELLLNYEFARSRSAFVRRYIDAYSDDVNGPFRREVNKSERSDAGN